MDFTWIRLIFAMQDTRENEYSKRIAGKSEAAMDMKCEVSYQGFFKSRAVYLWSRVA